jgi:GDPmannose 4,6-dehydratase
MYAYWITVNYREAYKMHASNGILFNHESPLRGETFVTRKITRAAARIAMGMQEKLFLGNLSSQRDWGHAKDYVKAMYLILQQDQPDDYVIATGITTEVREFVRLAFSEIGINIEFKGEGVEEKGYVASVDEEKFNLTVGQEFIEKIKSTQTPLVEVDPAYFRPTEVELLIGDATKSRTKLNWAPEYDLKGLVEDMMKSDVKLMKKETYLKEGGFRTMNYYE